jgi:hypothetical protein
METVAQKLLKEEIKMKEQKENEWIKNAQIYKQKARDTVNYIIKHINDNLSFYVNDIYFKNHQLRIAVPKKYITNDKYNSVYATYVHEFMKEEGLRIIRRDDGEMLFFSLGDSIYPPEADNKYFIWIGIIE